MKTLIFQDLFLFFFPIFTFSQNHFFQKHGESELCGSHLTHIKQKSESISYINGFTKPYVINNNDSFSFHIETGLSDVLQIVIKSTSFSTLLQNNEIIDSLILFDEGYGADELAGDNIFSTGNLTFNNNINYVSGWFLRFCDFTFTFKDSLQSNETIDLGFGIRRVNLENIDIPTITPVDDSMQVSNHVVNIVNENWNSSKEIIKKYYSEFQDNRDVIMLATIYPTPGEPAASYETIRITEEGTHFNTPVFDNSLSYGSHSKLMGIMRFYYSYGGQNNLLVHEILHQWAAYLNPQLYLNSDAHWGVIVVKSSGFGSGWQVSYITQVNDTLFLAERDTSYSNHYNKLEQYLMGLIPLDSVDFPIETLANFEFQDIINGVYSHKSDTGILLITQSMFESMMPQRDPNYLQSQKEFTSSLIVISDRLLSSVEMAYYDFQMKQNELAYTDSNLIAELGINFQEATYGQAKLETVLPPLCRKYRSDTSLVKSICYGDSIQIGDSIFTKTGNYSVTLTNQYGCDSIVNLSLAVNPIPYVYIGNDTIIAEDDILVLSSNNNFSSYLWSTGETTGSITILGSVIGLGEFKYWLKAINENNCYNSDTILITINESTTINNLIFSGFVKIYPNPTTNEIIIQNNSNSILLVELISLRGERLFSREYLDDQYQVKIDISGYTPACYLLKVKINNEIKFYKIIKEFSLK